MCVCEQETLQCLSKYPLELSSPGFPTRKAMGRGPWLRSSMAVTQRKEGHTSAGGEQKTIYLNRIEINKTFKNNHKIYK